MALTSLARAVGAADAARADDRLLHLQMVALHRECRFDAGAPADPAYAASSEAARRVLQAFLGAAARLAAAIPAVRVREVPDAVLPGCVRAETLPNSTPIAWTSFDSSTPSDAPRGGKPPGARRRERDAVAPVVTKPRRPAARVRAV